jgi:hypothetical protein
VAGPRAAPAQGAAGRGGRLEPAAPEQLGDPEHRPLLARATGLGPHRSTTPSARARLSTNEAAELHSVTAHNAREGHADGSSPNLGAQRALRDSEDALADDTSAAAALPDHVDGSGAKTAGARATEREGPNGATRAARASQARALSAEAAASARGESTSDDAPVVRGDAFVPEAIDDELSWLSAAQEALRRHQPTRALKLVQEHAFRFPRGALAEERRAVQVLALCALQRKQAARAVLHELEQRAPSSPLVTGIRRSCGL